MVSTVKSLGINDSSDLLGKFENHLISHLLQNVVTPNQTVSLSLEASTSLLTGNNSTAKQLLKLRKEMNANGLENEFIDALFSIVGTERTKGDYLDNIRMFSKRMNKQQADILAGAAQDLFNVNPDIAKRIFKTTLVQSGLNNSYMSYHNLLPAQWFHSLVRDVLDVYREGAVNTSNVIDDFYRNNKTNGKLIPTAKGKGVLRYSTRNQMVIPITNARYNEKMYVKRHMIP